MSSALRPAAVRSPVRDTPSMWSALGRQLGYWRTVYRRTWRGSVATSFLEPLGYLVAMGVGLGSFVNGGKPSAALGGIDYLSFIAPALMASVAMQIAMSECTYTVMSRVKWSPVFQAMLSTPLRPRDVIAGQLAYASARAALSCTVFLVFMVLFGIPLSGWAILMIPAGTLVGAAFAAALTAVAVHTDTDSTFSLVYRLALFPMFLFSGSFFPVSQLPRAIEWLAYVTPLWHGVDLCRQLSTGDIRWPALIAHLIYLSAWVLAGFWLAARLLAKRLTA